MYGVMHRAGDTAVAPAAPGPPVTVIAAVLCCAVLQSLSPGCCEAPCWRRGFIPKEFDFSATFGT